VRHDSLRSRALVLPMAFWRVGCPARRGDPAPRLRVQRLAVTVAIILIGRTLIRFEVFKPLADLNAS